LEIVTKDTQSNPNRASEVTQELILKDKVHIVVGFSTPETVTPVADQCELNGVPCVTNDDPLESYFFGRKGDPKRPFDWTYNYFFSGRLVTQCLLAAWARLGTNRKIGVLWANDDDGRVFAKVMPAQINDGGFTVVDPGRFDLPASDYTPEISKFKSEGAEIVWTIVPGPDFTIFWNQCAQQKYTPKSLSAGKVGEFPRAVYPYGNRGINFLQEVWWSKYHPYTSSLTGQACRDLADEYEKDANQQASMALGFRYSLLEIALASLKATQKLDDPASIRNAVRDGSFKTIVGPVDFKTGPFPNTSLTPLVAGQWRKGSKWPLEMVVVDNTFFPEIPVNGQPEPLQSI
jgi:branched-chain amino acid transport system substrate-binding protein